MEEKLKVMVIEAVSSHRVKRVAFEVPAAWSAWLCHLDEDVDGFRVSGNGPRIRMYLADVDCAF